jgi:hypothetical protein
MNLREAAGQALDALIWTTGSEDFSENGKAREGALNLLFPAITALRAALSEDVPETNFGNMAQSVDCYGDGNVYHTNGMPAVEGPLSKAHRISQESRHVEPVATINKMETVEPVAWLIESYDIYAKRTLQRLVFDNPKNMQGVKITAYYTAQPKRKPLTKESLLYIYNQLPNWGMDMDSLPKSLEKFARAIEREHDIGSEE